MRVLFVSNYAHLPDITGGLQTTTHDLCLAIKAIGGDAAVLCGRLARDKDSPELPASGDESLGYLVLRADTPELALPMAAAAWGADAIVVQSGTALAPMVLASLSSGRPTAVYLHNVETHQLAGHLAPDPSLLYLANSDFTAQRWHALYGIDCAVIPPVIAQEPYLVAQTGDKVLFVNPIPIKGVEMLFSLAAACPELPFLVMESWNINPHWRAYCLDRAAQLGNIEWHRPTQDMREVFAHSRLLLMPSVWEESFGRTVVEAQLNGLPVLASNRGALPQLVGQGGHVLAPEAPIQEWAHALRQLYDPVISAVQRDAAQRQAMLHVTSTPVIAGRLLSLLALHASQTTRAAESRPARAYDASDIAVPPVAHAATPVVSTPSLREISPRAPRREDCDFYHSYTLADGEEVTGQWDLRPDSFAYLGDTGVTGQSVLEIGPASGFLSFYMEAAGASVTCLEPPMSHLWDVVPFKEFDHQGWRDEFTNTIEKVRNSFWYVHHQNASRVRMFEGDPYLLPEDFGPFDISLLASILLHCRRPFDMLQSVAERTRSTIIVTELHDPTLGEEPLCRLLPHTGVNQVHTWWHFTPQFFISALGLLGFTQFRVTYHTQKQPAEDREVPMFTVVCEKPSPSTGGTLA
ncbi:glycosyltransferase [Rhodoferax saidenbachensis]|uniref:Glycosyl transferase family 1 n=1 Tax=Rhodoferax saidenbachensis TaxID=1484693 RepID=A0A1P8KE93_9BURK|nr:glycosyltransferase [Rhodoferax saidenbachensis]APW44329.1 glycosyl transferase family 1 [Rhodoferax saidenbachensis]